MIFHVENLLLLGPLLAAVHWTIARSEIGKPVWSRAKGRFKKLLECPACSGYWLGLVAPPLVFEGNPWVCHLIQGLLGIWITPVFEAILVWALEYSAILDEEDIILDPEPYPDQPTVP